MDTLSLSVPEQHDFNDPTVERDITRLKHWLTSLPVMDVVETVRMVVVALDSMNEQKLDFRERFDYLEVAIEEYEEDGDKEAFLIALRHVVKAQGGVKKIAERTGLNREHLFRMLSAKGNPRLDTIGKILHGLGFRLSVTHLNHA